MFQFSGKISGNSIVHSKEFTDDTSFLSKKSNSINEILKEFKKSRVPHQRIEDLRADKKKLKTEITFFSKEISKVGRQHNNYIIDLSTKLT